MAKGQKQKVYECVWEELVALVFLIMQSRFCPQVYYYYYYQAMIASTWVKNSIFFDIQYIFIVQSQAGAVLRGSRTQVRRDNSIIKI